MFDVSDDSILAQSNLKLNENLMLFKAKELIADRKQNIFRTQEMKLLLEVACFL